jgi:hypothetical protein
MVEEDDGFDLDLATAALRADSGDVRILLKVLSQQLSEALGDRLVVRRAGGRFRKSESIEALAIDLGSDQFSASLKGSSLTCSISHASGGIRIRSEQVEVDEWIGRLLRALREEAAHSQATRAALESIVIRGHQ